MKWAVVAVLLGALTSGQAVAAETVRIDKIISGDEVSLADGRVLRLAGVKAASSEAEAWLRAQAEGHAARLQAVSTDRYGRTAATLYLDGHDLPVQDDMLRAGMAFVYPLTGGEAYVDNLLAAEATARAEKRGFWAQAFVPADEAAPLIGHYGFVEGVVTDVARVGGKVYINFGEDWRDDFTITIRAKNVKMFRQAGVDPMAFKGRTVRVRGWVTRDSGPGVTVTDPRQIEMVSQ